MSLFSPITRRPSWNTLYLQAIILLLSVVTARAAGPATRPYLLHFPGVSGVTRVDRNLFAGLKLGGLDADYDFYDWTGPDKGVNALHSYQHNHIEATLAAAQVAAHFRAHPDSRIILTSHSGGGAIAIWTLEQLPADVHVASVLLLAPAISPDYDLTKALRHVDGKLSLFSSTGDELILGIGCRLCGTMDGKMTDAAGRVGFTRPATGDPLEYAKLEQHPYEKQWDWLGNYGDHIGPMSRPFAAKILTPLVEQP
jgi:pimeloyl-ACP methyl ester carboxylesterase